jgi:hypothetical protein
MLNQHFSTIYSKYLTNIFSKNIGSIYQHFLQNVGSIIFQHLLFCRTPAPATTAHRWSVAPREGRGGLGTVERSRVRREGRP